ncbi:MAG: hypothetical protein PUP91_24805 [Rhizonema sp. PD37]|nr:hypothetical protein [Rhizonema sp. PD37]
MVNTGVWRVNQRFPQARSANPEPRIQMLDGFNEGWIEFEHGELGSIKGKVELETVLKSLFLRSNLI